MDVTTGLGRDAMSDGARAEWSALVIVAVPVAYGRSGRIARSVDDPAEAEPTWEDAAWQ
jgi:hypothetical protein